MMLDLATLASIVVTRFLAPLLKKGAKNLAAEIQNDDPNLPASQIVDVATELWDLTKATLAKPDESSALTLFENNPEAMQPMLTEIISRRLTQQTDFEQAVRRLIEEPSTSKAVPLWQLTGTLTGAVDARNATISNSTIAGVINSGPSSE